MTLKKPLMLACMALAAIALAVPASASAEVPDGSVFLHEGNEVTETAEVVLGGTFQPVSGTISLHCEELEMVVDLLVDGTGEVTAFNEKGCLWNGVLPADGTVVETHEWSVEADSTKGEIDITDIEVHYLLTHPVNGVVVGTVELEGDMSAELLGDPENSSTFNIAGNMSLMGSSVIVSGHLTSEDSEENPTEIGVR